MSGDSLSMAPALLRRGRMHEVCGAGGAAFAAAAAAQLGGALFWIVRASEPARLCPAGLTPALAPGRLLCARAATARDLLWLAEEALRAGVFSLVAAQPARPLSLTAGRRLQLAAQAGGSTALLWIGAGADCPAAESRWRCAPVWTAAGGAQTRCELVKDKRGRRGKWLLRWGDETGVVHLVPEAGERAGAAA